MQILENPTTIQPLIDSCNEIREQYSFVKAVNLAVFVINNWINTNSLTLQQLVDESIVEFNPNHADLYKKILPTSPEDLLTCFDYAYWLQQNITWGKSKIYVAEKNNKSGIHMAAVVQDPADNKRYLVEPGINRQAPLEITVGSKIANDKYTMEIDRVEANGDFTMILSTDLGSVFNFQFKSLASQTNIPISEVYGYITLKHYLFSKSQIYISNINSKTLEVAVFLPATKEQPDSLMFVLPDKTLPEKSNNQNQELPKSTKHFIKITQLEDYRSLITEYFGGDAFNDLVIFKNNLDMLKAIHKLYPDNIDMI